LHAEAPEQVRVGEKGLPGPVGYWHVSDVAALDRLLAAGARRREAVSAVGGGKLSAAR
jgi:hypothetical protein